MVLLSVVEEFNYRKVIFSLDVFSGFFFLYFILSHLIKKKKKSLMSFQMRYYYFEILPMMSTEFNSVKYCRRRYRGLDEIGTFKKQD